MQLKLLRLMVTISQLMIAALALALAGGYLAAAYLGAGFAVVEGASMEPLLHTGDLVVLVKKQPGDIAVGDIVVFRSGEKFVIHRVVYKYEGPGGVICFVTKGDNNVLPDLGDPLTCGSRIVPGLGLVTGRPYSDIVGVVVEVGDVPLKIPYVGMVRIIVDSLLGFLK